MATKRVKIVAIGGPSCSGKTTLVKHVKRIIGDQAFVWHQDDYAPPASEIPVHAVHKVQDWDDPEGAISWPVMREALQQLKQAGTVPVTHTSHDHLNLQTPVPISDKVTLKWEKVFASLPSNTAIVLLDGFLLYWDEECARSYDVKILIREQRDVLKHRRDERNGYFLTCELFILLADDIQTAIAQTDQERVLWKDPPGFFDNIVWPAYVKAHGKLYKDGQVETGDITDPSILLLEARQMDMAQMVDTTCQAVFEACK